MRLWPSWNRVSIRDGRGCYRFWWPRAKFFSHPLELRCGLDFAGRHLSLQLEWMGQSSSSYCDWAEKKKRRHEHVSSWIDMIQLWAFHPVEIPADAFSLFSLLICWTGPINGRRGGKKRKFDAVDAFTEEKKIGKEEEDGREDTVRLMELNPSSSSSPVVVIRLPIAFIRCWAGLGRVSCYGVAANRKCFCPILFHPTELETTEQSSSSFRRNGNRPSPSPSNMRI